MRIAKHKVAELASRRGYSLSRLLREAGVSRTAYYSLAAKDTILPKSVHAIARTLGVRPRDVVTDDGGADHERALVLLREARKICRSDRGASFDNVWHALCLLELPPIDRLNRSLIRGRARTAYR